MMIFNRRGVICARCGYLIHVGSDREYVQDKPYHPSCADKQVEENRLKEWEALQELSRKLC